MEIERKWLLPPGFAPDTEGAEKLEMEQAYLCFHPSVRIRSINGTDFILTVKAPPLSGTPMLSREEFETALSGEAYRMLLKKREGEVIQKTRYRRQRPDGLVEETDIFHGALAGLAYMEIEFPTEEAALSFSCPNPAFREVTWEKGYSNADLARCGLPDDI